jgi:hypothetical protein
VKNSVLTLTFFFICKRLNYKEYKEYSTLTITILTWWQCSQPQQYPRSYDYQFIIIKGYLECCNFLHFFFRCVLCWVSWKVPHGNTKDNVDNCCGDLVGMQKWWYRQKVTGGRAQTLQVTTHIAVVFQCPI